MTMLFFITLSIVIISERLFVLSHLFSWVKNDAEAPKLAEMQ